MDKQELRDDITKVSNYMDATRDLESRMALERLLQILRAWRQA